jgi:hypothetical protein
LDFNGSQGRINISFLQRVGTGVSMPALPVKRKSFFYVKSFFPATLFACLMMFRPPDL